MTRIDSDITAIASQIPSIVRDVFAWSMMPRSNASLRTYPSFSQMQADTGLSRPSISKAINWMIEHGMIALVDPEHRSGYEQHLSSQHHVYQITGVVCINETVYITVTVAHESDVADLMSSMIDTAPTHWAIDFWAQAVSTGKRDLLGKVKERNERKERKKEKKQKKKRKQRKQAKKTKTVTTPKCGDRNRQKTKGRQNMNQFHPDLISYDNTHYNQIFNLMADFGLSDQWSALIQVVESQTSLSGKATYSLVNMLNGKSKTGEWAKYNITPPVHPLEFNCACAHWRHKNGDAHMVQRPEKVFAMVMDFRKHVNMLGEFAPFESAMTKINQMVEDGFIPDNPKQAEMPLVSTATPQHDTNTPDAPENPAKVRFWDLAVQAEHIESDNDLHWQIDDNITGDDPNEA